MLQAGIPTLYLGLYLEALSAPPKDVDLFDCLESFWTIIGPEVQVLEWTGLSRAVRSGCLGSRSRWW